MFHGEASSFCVSCPSRPDPSRKRTWTLSWSKTNVTRMINGRFRSRGRGVGAGQATRIFTRVPRPP